MKKQRDIIAWAINHSTIVFLLAVAGIVLGIYGLVVMPKQEFPLITIRQGLVIGVFYIWRLILRINTFLKFMVC